MFKKSKKTIALLTTLMITLTGFSGCGTKASTDNVKPSTTAGEKPKGKITVWGWDAIKKSTDANMDAFKKAYPDIQVDFQTVPTSDLYKKLLLGISSGGEGLADVVTLESSHLGQMISTGGLADISDKTKSYTDKIVKSKWGDTQKDGKTYAMPWDIGPVGLYYRRDVFEKAGLPSEPDKVSTLLKTWDDYYNTAKIIKDKTGANMLAISQDKNDATDYEKLMWQQGELYFDKAGNPTSDNAASVKTTEFLGKLIKAGYTDNTVDWTQPRYDGYKNGSVATIVGASWYGGFLKSWIAPDTKGKWGVIPLPVWTGSKAITANSGGSSMAIPSASKNKDAAWAYIEFMLGRVDSQMAMYKATDVFPSLIECYSNPYFTEADPFCGGQQSRKVFADLAKQIPDVTYTKNYPQAEEDYMNAFAKYVLKGTPASQALKEANDSVKSKID